MLILALSLNLAFTVLVIDKITVKNGGTFKLLKVEAADFVEIYKTPLVHHTMTYACAIMSVSGYLAFSLSLLSVVAAWAESMRDAGRPYQRKINAVLYSVRVFKVLYVIFSLGQIVCVTMAAVSSLAVIDSLHGVCNFWMLVVTIWMLLDLNDPANDLIRVKRNQLIRIFFMVLFQVSIICNYTSLKMRIIGAVFLVFECCLLMFPNTLVDLEVSPPNVYPVECDPIEKV